MRRGTHTTPSGTHDDDDSVVLNGDKSELRGTLRCSGSNVGCVVKISEETEKETEEPEDPDEVTEDPDEVRELLYTRLDWLRMWKKLLQ